MARNTQTVNLPTDVIAILNTNAITSTALWYVVPRLNLGMTENYDYTYQPKARLENIVTDLNALNASDYYVGRGSCSCNEVAIQTKAISITESYVYDVYYYTP